MCLNFHHFHRNPLFSLQWHLPLLQQCMAQEGGGHFVTGLCKFKMCRDKTQCTTKSLQDGEVGEGENGGQKYTCIYHTLQPN